MVLAFVEGSGHGYQIRNVIGEECSHFPMGHVAHDATKRAPVTHDLAAVTRRPQVLAYVGWCSLLSTVGCALAD